ncbi:DNA-processing protein DprA [Candidatus Saccharibacteria bacterium]|nr:DNA-processing protein DprA [Candidatus Saccharibacteria bacterium]
MKINHILPQESKFTEVLDAIAVKPKMLYFYGKMPENVVLEDKKGAKREQRAPAVAIVGARKCTPYGAEIAYKAAYELAKLGVVVVSGMALGIDGEAHKGALAAGGVTVAVLGTAIDKLYPVCHQKLAEQIMKQGAVMSEYAPGTEMYAARFLERNRLIAGLADAVLVVEANERSGSLNTATHALEQGKDLFAVPGDITRPLSRGCNKLIQQGAYPYTEPADILQTLFPVSMRKLKQPSLLGDNEEESAVLKAIAAGVRDGERIAKQLEWGPAQFNQVITMLEIKGRVRGLGMNQWALV